jgi:hypothetical protein
MATVLMNAQRQRKENSEIPFLIVGVAPEGSFLTGF